MADPAGIEASQERLHREVLQGAREQALRQALGLWDQTLAVGTMPWPDVLEHVMRVCTEERARLEADTP
jgi:hypothetical protein